MHQSIYISSDTVHLHQNLKQTNKILLSEILRHFDHLKTTMDNFVEIIVHKNVTRNINKHRNGTEEITQISQQQIHNKTYEVDVYNVVVDTPIQSDNETF